jgi:hypothetical protein
MRNIHLDYRFRGGDLTKVASSAADEFKEAHLKI